MKREKAWEMDTEFFSEQSTGFLATGLWNVAGNNSKFVYVEGLTQQQAKDHMTELVSNKELENRYA